MSSIGGRVKYIYNDNGLNNVMQAYIKKGVYGGDAFLQEKLAQYRLFWNFYNNKHWKNNNGKLLSFNYCKALINKVNEFTLGNKGFEVNIENSFGEEVSEVAEKEIEALINFTWKQNKGNKLLAEIFQMGGITGDVYILVYYAEDMVKIKMLDTRFIIPISNNGDYSEIIGYKYIKPLSNNPNKYTQKITLYTKNTQVTYYTKETEGERFEEETVETNLGFIPVVHIENNINGGEYGGYSDIQDIIKINRVYNELAEDVKSIVDYYTTPVTIVKGATMGNLKRGLGEVWSGLPAEASVNTLGLGEDLSNSTNFMEMLKRAMHDLSGVPEEVLSKVQHISNTSNAALKTLYYSLTMAADRKVLTYGEGLEEVNTIILRTWLLFNNELPIVTKVASYEEQIKSGELVAEPIFTYGLPNDRMTVLQEGQIEIQTKTGSRREIMQRMGKKNIPKILKEIEADSKILQPESKPTLGVKQENL